MMWKPSVNAIWLRAAPRFDASVSIAAAERTVSLVDPRDRSRTLGHYDHRARVVLPAGTGASPSDDSVTRNYPSCGKKEAPSGFEPLYEALQASA